MRIGNFHLHVADLQAADDEFEARQRALDRQFWRGGAAWYNPLGPGAGGQALRDSPLQAQGQLGLMHILLIHQIFIRPQDAGGTRHYEFARHLVRRGHRVTVIAGSRSYLTGEPIQAPKREIIEPGFEILRAFTLGGVHRNFLTRTLGFISFMLSAAWLGLRVKGLDLIWGTSPPLFQGLSAWFVARMRRLPFLFEVRDLWPYFAVAVGVLRQPLLIRLAEWAERTLLRNADRVLVNSPGFLDHVQSRGARWVDLIPNGVDPQAFDPEADGSEFRKAHGLEGKFLVVYTGAHGMSNDLDVALEAARHLRGDDEIRLVLIGDGKEKPRLVQEAEQEGLRNVLFLPPVPKAEIPRVLAAADACLAILRPIEAYRTTYPNKVFDYMAAGKPVVLAIDGVIREVVERESAGVAAPPGDGAALARAIRELAADREAAAAMGRRGRAAVETSFNRRRLAQELETLLEAIVAPPISP